MKHVTFPPSPPASPVQSIDSVSNRTVGSAHDAQEFLKKRLISLLRPQEEPDSSSVSSTTERHIDAVQLAKKTKGESSLCSAQVFWMRGLVYPKPSVSLSAVQVVKVKEAIDDFDIKSLKAIRAAIGQGRKLDFEESTTLKTMLLPNASVGACRLEAQSLYDAMRGAKVHHARSESRFSEHTFAIAAPAPSSSPNRPLPLTPPKTQSKNLSPSPPLSPHSLEAARSPNIFGPPNSTTLIKHLRSKSDRERIGLPQKTPSVRELQGVDGKRIFMTSTLVRGAYGKVRPAVDMEGRLLAVKQMRTVDSKQIKYVRNATRSPIRASKLENIAREIEMAHIIDPDLAPIGQYHIDADVYLIFPKLMVGDGLSIAKRSGNKDRRGVCRVMGLDVAQRLCHDIHGRGLIHGDMKFDNTIVDQSIGQVHICDFGSAKKLDINGEIQGRIPSTFTAPEKVSGFAYGAKSDIWEMGAALLSLYVGDNEALYPNPFAAIPNLDGTLDKKAMARRFMTYEAWKASTLHGSGDVAPEPLRGDRMSRIFDIVSKHDPIVAKFIFQRMLVVDPERRADSQELLEFFRDLAQSEPDTMAQGRSILQNAPFAPDAAHHIETLRSVIADAKQAPSRAPTGDE